LIDDIPVIEQMKIDKHNILEEGTEVVKARPEDLQYLEKFMQVNQR
jgi:hypothetical protein